MEKAAWIPAELDAVVIPEALARKKGVRVTGTVVWHVASAPYATVECYRIAGQTGLETELLDVPLADLQPARV